MDLRRLLVSSSLLLLGALASNALADGTMGPVTPNLLRGDDGAWQGELEAGTYRLRNGSDPGAIDYIYTEPDRTEQQGLHVSVEIAGDWAGGTSRAGLIYGLDPNATRYYAFVLERDGTIALLRRGDQGLKAVLSTETEAVRPEGSNQLSLVEQAGTVHLQVNGQELASIENEDVGTGAVGIVAMGEGAYRFRDFRVSAGQQRRTDRIQEPQGAAERSRITAETSREISQMQQQSWEQQQRTKDLMAERFSRYVRGVTRYQDPATGEQLELASGYAQAWRSGDEYILAQDPGFDPNTVSQQDWTRLRALE